MGTVPARSARVAFLVLVAAGAATHLVAAWCSWGGEHPDEHQQYLEQGYRLAFGFGQTYWEQEYGLRNELYPRALAVGLRGLAAAGVADPVIRAAVLRGAVGLAVFAALAWVAWDRFRDGRAVWGLTYLAFAALSPAAVLVSVRFLSETVMIVPLAVGIVLLPRRPLLAGVLFGLAFAVRFPSAFLTAGFVLVALIENQARAARLMAGVLVGLVVFVGVADWLTFGAPFHSPIEHFRHNVLLGKNADYGREPWWYYAVYGGADLVALSVLAPLLVVLGAAREWRWAVPLGLLVLGHSALAHKEGRFLWGALPLILGLVAGGTEALHRWAARRGRGRLALAAVAVSALPSLALLHESRFWNQPAYRATAEGLRVVGRQPDATGVAFPVPVALAGNYFFLDRNLPLEAPLDQPREHLPPWDARVRDPARRINYLIAPPEIAARFADLDPAPVATVSHGWVVYRLTRPGP